MLIRAYQPGDEAAVISLWKKTGLTRPWNNPAKDIARKLAVQAEWFLVAQLDEKIVATVMAGYDGHRGWVNYLAVDQAYQGKGIARKLMCQVETRLKDFGCPKINLQIREDNQKVMEFYQKLGYQPDRAVSFGKRLIPD